MSRPLIALFLGIFSLAAQAQQPGYLVMIDGEAEHSFQVRVDDTVITSSGLGHVVIPNLRDSSYAIAVQFPRQPIAEQEFHIDIRKKDCGFQLRRASENRWVLYNWQTQEMKYGTELPDSIRFGPRGVRRDDAFSALMAAVVNDSAVRYNTYTGAGFGRDTVALATLKAKKDSAAREALVQFKKDSALRRAVAKSLADSLATVRKALAKARADSVLARKALLKTRADSALAARKARADSLLAARNARAKNKADSLAAARNATAVKKDSAFVANVVPASSVRKVREVSLKISRKMVFVDGRAKRMRDTVTLFIFFEKGTPPDSAAIAAQWPPDPVPVVKADTPQAKSAETAALWLAPGTAPASDNDVDSLRQLILDRNSVRQKVNAAEKVFSQKTFNTTQIRMIAGLFSSEKGKYRLLEASAHHVSDTSNFAALGDLLTDQGYVKKFRNLQ